MKRTSLRFKKTRRPDGTRDTLVTETSTFTKSFVNCQDEKPEETLECTRTYFESSLDDALDPPPSTP